MAQAGLGYIDPLRQSAGIGESLTMRDDYQTRMRLARQGVPDDEIDRLVGRVRAAAALPEVDPRQGIGEELAFQGRSMAGHTLTGMGELAEDVLGLEGVGDFLKGAGDYVGPSEDQMARQAAEEQWKQEKVESGEWSPARKFASDAGEAVLGGATSIVPALVGGIAGAAAGGPLGAIAGAAAMSAPMLYEESLSTAEAHGGHRDDPEVQEAAGYATLANMALEALPPARALNRLNKAGADEILQAVYQKAGKEAIKQGGEEGLTEVAQMATNAIAHDQELWDQLTAEEKDGLFPYLVEEYGREAALNMIAGGVVGGAMGGGVGARTQYLQNAALRQKIAVLGQASQEAGVSDESYAELAKTPEGVRDIGLAVEEIAAAERQRRYALEALTEAKKVLPEGEEVPARLEARAVEAGRKADAVHDKWISSRFGGLSSGQIRERKAAVEAETRSRAEEVLAKQGVAVPAGVATEKVATIADELAAAAADREQAQQRMALAVTPKEQVKAKKRFEKALDAEASVYEKVAKDITGGDPVAERKAFVERVKAEASAPAEMEAKAKADEAKQAEIDQLRMDLFTDADGIALDPEVVRARAQELIANEEAALKKARPTQIALDRAKEKLKTAKSAKSVRGLRDKIADLQGKLAREEPLAVSAARQALRELEGGPVAEAPSVEAGAEAEGTPAPAPESVDKATEAGVATEVKGEASPEAAETAPAMRPVSKEAGRALTAATKALRAAPAGDVTARTAAVQAAERVLTEAGVKPTTARIDRMLKDGPVATRLRAAAKLPDPEVALTPKEKQAQRLREIIAEERGKGTEEGDKRATTAEVRLATVEAEIAAGKTGEIAAPGVSTDQRDAGFPVSKSDAKTYGMSPWKSIVSEVEGMTLEEVEAKLRADTDRDVGGDGIERSVTFDADGNLLGAGHNGSENVVSIPANGWNRPGVTKTHSHPYDTPLSLADIELLASMGKGATIRAVTPKRIYSATAGGPEFSRDRVISAYNQVTNTVIEMLGEGSFPAGIGNIELARIVQQAGLDHLESLGLLDVTTDERIDNDLVNEIVERAASASEAAPSGGAFSDARERFAAAAGQPGRAAGVSYQAGQAQGQAPTVEGIIFETEALRDRVKGLVDQGLTAGEAFEEPSVRDAWRNIGAMMLSVPGTNSRPGYGTPGDFATRQYVFDGEVVVGRPKAVARLARHAMQMAADETGLPYVQLRSDREAIVVIGPPGAGKSTIAGKIAYDSGSALIDSDEAKKVLPEYADGAGAGMVHDESVDIANDVLEFLSNRGVNLVFQKIGGTVASLQRVVDHLEGKGYRTRFVLQDVTPTTAIDRMAGRFLKTGRLIPSYASEGIGFRPQETMRALIDQGIGDGHTILDGEVGFNEALPIKQTAGDAPITGQSFNPRGVSVRYSGRGDDLSEIRSKSGAGAAGQGRGERVQPPLAAGLSLFRTADAPQPKDFGGIGADPERVSDLTGALIERTLEGAKGPGRKHSLAKLLQSGELTQANLNDGLNLATGIVSSEGSEAASVVWNVARAMFPKAKLDPKAFQKVKKVRGKATVTEVHFPQDWQDRINAAYRFLRDVGQEEGMGFGIEKMWHQNRKNGFWFNPKHFTISKEMQDYLQISPPQANDFTMPMADPTNTDAIVRTPKTNRMSADALEAARATARVLQSNTYRLDQDAVGRLTDDDFISDKKLGAFRLKRTPEGIVSAVEGATELSEEQQRNLRTQRFRARRRREAFQRIARKHGDRPVGFRYRVDDKGRISADGPFTPQTGDAVKKALGVEIDGEFVVLSDMPTVDHSASGWQVAVLIARDEVAAPHFNLEGGTALQEGYSKRDLYNAMMADLKAEIISDAASSPDEKTKRLAGLFKEKVFDTGQPFGKAQVKAPVIAVNYGAEASKFTEEFANLYRDQFAGFPKPTLAGLWGYVGGKAYGQLEKRAPKALAFQRWAIGALQELVEKVEAKQPIGAPPVLEFSVGLDGTFARKKLKEKDLRVRATAGADDTLEQTLTIPIPEVDAKGTARSIYSQLIQAFDASILHEGVARFKDGGGGFVTTNHDSYSVQPGQAGQVAAAARAAMRSVMEEAGDVPARLRNEIIAQAEKHGVTLEKVDDPALFNPDGSFRYGGYDLADVETSVPTFVENADDAPPRYADVAGETLEGAPSYPPLARGLPGFAKAIDFAAADVGERTGIRLDTSLPKAWDIAQSGSFRTGRDFKLRMQEMSLQSQAEQGIDLTALVPENVDRLGDFLVEDARAALVDNSGAIGWYGRTVTEAKRLLAVAHPELTPGSEAEFQFTWALAVTSNGLRVDKNFELADAAYGEMKRIGAFPTDVGVGTATMAINDGLALYPRLVAKLGGWEAARDFMVSRRPVREIESLSGINVSSEGKAEILPGAVILGPKIGGGFFSNLYGNFDELTMDRWFMRTLGRWRGTLIGQNPKMEEKKRGEIREVLKGLSTEEMSHLRGFFNGYAGPVRKVMSDQAVNGLAEEIAKRSAVPDWRQRFSATPAGDALRRNGNMLAVYLDGQIERPAGVKERAFIRDVFRRGLDRLRATPDMSDLTMADLQALLWYPEKRLYDTAGKKEGVEALGYEADEAPDYANAARKLAEQKRGSGRGGGVRDVSGSAGAGRATPPLAAGVDVAVGLDVQADSVLGKRGVEGVTPEQARAVMEAAAKAAGVTLDKTRKGQGGWFNPDTRQIEAESSTITEVDGPAGSIAAFAALVGKHLGQYSVLTTEVLPDGGGNGHVVRINNVDPARVFAMANRVAPNTFTGFSATERGLSMFVPADAAGSIEEDTLALMEELENDPETGSYEVAVDGANGVFVEGGTDGEGYAPAIRDFFGGNATAQVDRDVGRAAQAIPSARAGDRRAGVAERGEAGGPPAGRDDAAGRASSEGDQGSVPGRGAVQPLSDGRARHLIGEIARADRSTPNAAAAGLRHSGQYDYGAVERSGEGRPFLRAHLDFTSAFAKEMFALAGRYTGERANFLRAMGIAQFEDHRAKVADALVRKLITPAEMTSAGVYRPAPVPAAGISAPLWMDMGVAEKASLRETYNKVVDVARNPGAHSRSLMEAVEDQVFNRFAPIRRLEMDTRGKLGIGAESAFKAAETAVNDSGRNEQLMFYGAAKRGAHGEFTVAPGTKGLRQIFDTVANSVPAAERGQAMADWMGYMVARRIKELKARGFKGVFPVSDAEIDAFLARETPAFKDAADNWRRHNEANIDFLVDTGRITEEQADAMKETEAYVPFYRSQAGTRADGTSPDLDLSSIRRGPRAGGQILARDPGIKALKGGDKLAFDNIMTNMIRNSQAMVAAGMRNDAANKTFELMEEAGLATSVKGSPSKKPSENAVAVWRDGKKKWVVLRHGDAEPLLVAMAGLQPLQLGRIQSLMAGVGSVFRQGITLSPAFMVRNAIRGAVATGLLSGGANLTVANNTLTGFRQAYGNSQATQAFKAMSGMGDYRFGGVDVGFGKNDILIEYGLAPKSVGYRIRRAIDAAEAVGTATELADRVAMYNSLVERGIRPDEAAYQARAVMDYARKGANAELRAWLPMVPFLNARLQGYSRLAEGALNRKTGEGFGSMSRKQALMNLALHGAVLMALSGALWARNVFDDDREEKYKQEPLHRRLNYHIVYLGDKTLLIPKAFELGHIFSSIPELFGDAMVTDMNEIGPGIKKIAADTVMFNLIPAAVAPVIEGIANYSFFTGAPIENQRESSMRARDRVSGASSISRFIGQQLGVSDLTKISPTMIEHFLQGYGGTYFLTAASAMDVAASEMGIGSAPVAGAFGDVPLASSALQRAFGSMLKVTDQSSTKYVEEFYRNKDFITQIHRSAKDAAGRGDVEYAQQLLARVPATPAAYRTVNKASAQLSKINAAIRDIRADTKMTPAQKSARITPLIRTRNELVRAVALVINQLEDAQGRTFKSAA